jgi:hypothetical protein
MSSKILNQRFSRALVRASRTWCASVAIVSQERDVTVLSSLVSGQWDADMVEIPVEIAVLHNFLATTNKNMAVYLKKAQNISAFKILVIVHFNYFWNFPVFSG